MSWQFNKIHQPRVYKCRICKDIINYTQGKYCNQCLKNRKDDIEKYEQKLESKRKYMRGNLITSINELEQCEYVYWNNMLKHIEFIKSLQYRIVTESIHNSRIYQAIKKEELNGK